MLKTIQRSTYAFNEEGNEESVTTDLYSSPKEGFTKGIYASAREGFTTDLYASESEPLSKPDIHVECEQTQAKASRPTETDSQTNTDNKTTDDQTTETSYNCKSGRIYGTHFKRPEKKVNGLRDLQPGDHIVWERFLALYDHHAIVKSINPENGTFTVYEFGPAKSSAKKIKFQIAEKKFREERVHLFKLEYIGDEHLKVEQTLDKAKELLGKEVDYNLLFRNCENASVHCKTGTYLTDTGDQVDNVVGKTLPRAAVWLTTFGLILEELLANSNIAFIAIQIFFSLGFAGYNAYSDYTKGHVVGHPVFHYGLHLFSALLQIIGGVGSFILANALLLSNPITMVISTLCGGLLSSVPWVILDGFRYGGEHILQILTDNIPFMRQILWTKRKVVETVKEAATYVAEKAGQAWDWVCSWFS